MFHNYTNTCDKFTGEYCLCSASMTMKNDVTDKKKPLMMQIDIPVWGCHFKQ